jgi:predicted nucleotide-binding protein
VNDLPGVEQQLVVHLFAPADGPRASAAYTALRELWLGCRESFLMEDPLPHGGLPHELPAEYRKLPDAAETGDEAVLAAQERPDADCQALLRRHHDVLNLSVVLAAPESAPAPAEGRSRWQDLDARWSFLSGRLTADLLGEARIYLARADAPPGPYLDDLLPVAAHVRDWQQDRAATDGRITLWEAPPWSNERELRRLVLAYGADKADHDLASGLAWSNGGTAIPPLARYLLHTAKLRYLYRVWRRDSTTHKLAAVIRSQVAVIRRAPAGRPGTGARAGELRRRAAEARLMTTDLLELRQAVEIAEYNMGLAITAPALRDPAGPFADDRGLAENFLAQLDDELRYLDLAARRADAATPLLDADGEGRTPAEARAVTSTPPAASPAPADDISRNVFVVHGRDEQARAALFGFLEALGLHPLGWERMVTATGSASPYLRDVIMQGIAMAQAMVVLMTPDDEVRLHHDLRRPDEDEHETHPAGQARPNVILELGMVLATYPSRTIVLHAGRHRPMADLGGLNYVQLTGDDGCLDKIISRLKTAGCPVGDTALSRQVRARFRRLAAYDRRPQPPEAPGQSVP